MKVLTLSAAALLLWTAQAAQAQQIDLRIENGLVTLDAENAPVSMILSEWARVGATRVVNGELVGGDPVTLQLDDVPEAEALDIVLRGAGGYVIAIRPVGGDGASVFDRIMVLASSDAPAASRTIIETTAPGGAGVTPVPQNVAPTRLPELPQPVQPLELPQVELEPADELEMPAVPPNPFGLPFAIPPGSSDRPGVIATPPEPE